jgi:hypothetical protein
MIFKSKEKKRPCRFNAKKTIFAHKTGTRNFLVQKTSLLTEFPMNLFIKI